jgi:chromosome segregation ATPase
MVSGIGAALFLSSCSGPSYDSQIAQLDSLYLRVDSIPARVNPLNPDTLTALASIAEGQLDYIQKNYVGFMKPDLAKVTSDYRMLRKALKTTAEGIQQMGNEVEITKKQLAELKKALVDKATHDAMGNPMDETYVNKAVAREKEEASKLIRNAPLLVMNFDRALRLYQEQHQRIEFLVDSIPALEVPQMNPSK